MFNTFFGNYEHQIDDDLKIMMVIVQTTIWLWHSTFGYHGLQMIFNFIEFLMSNVVFRIWHLFILMIYPTLYLIWIQTNMEARWVNIWPYDVIDYYRNPWFSIIVYSFGLFFVFCLSFFFYWLITTIRLRILTKRLKKIRFTRRNTQKMNAILKNSVAALVNTAIELDAIIDSPHRHYPAVVYTTANTSVASATTVTPPSSLTSSPAALHPSHGHEEKDTAMSLSDNTTIMIQSEDMDILDAPRGTKKTSDVVSKLVKISKNSAMTTTTPQIVNTSTPNSSTALIPPFNTRKVHPHDDVPVHEDDMHKNHDKGGREEHVLVATTDTTFTSSHAANTVITLSTPTPRAQAQQSLNIEFI